MGNVRTVFCISIQHITCIKVVRHVHINLLFSILTLINLTWNKSKIEESHSSRPNTYKPNHSHFPTVSLDLNMIQYNVTLQCQKH